MWECVAELNTSHAYVMPVAADDAPRVAWLGAEYTRNAKGEVVIRRVLPGESSDPTARSPLRAAGVAAAAGDVIVAVDGRPTADADDLGELLLGRPTRSSNSPSPGAGRSAVSRSFRRQGSRPCATTSGWPHASPTWRSAPAAGSATCTCPTWSPAAGQSSSGSSTAPCATTV
nr:PDZ domain-containing protein [Tessaracoccus coleopterorum]